MPLSHGEPMSVAAADLTYLSLGAGVQSTAMLVMAALGLRGCPRPSDAIFSDTGAEPQWVYDHLEWCERFASGHGIALHVVQKGNLGALLAKAARGEATRFGTIPAFTKGDDGRPAPLRRQCTREYKIEPIEKEVRRLMGFGHGERIAGKASAVGLIGISVDEVIRMKPARKKWIAHRFPLIDAAMTRSDCAELSARHGAHPRKSSCVFCPYHSDAFWLDLQKNHAEEFAVACQADRNVRNLTTAGVTRPAFLHRSLRPLDEVDFLRWRDTPGQAHLFNLDGFGNECEGVCGV